MLLPLSLVAIVTAWVLLLLQVEPVPTWFYVFVWYPTLVLMDEFGSRLDGRETMLWRRPMVYAFLWSPVVWFVFEVANFRLNNWYYVFLPHAGWERWLGIVLSFATVVPAVLLAERLMDAAGLFRRGKGPKIVIRTWELWFAVAAGIGMGVLALTIPQLFFPLIWGSVFLIVDPLVYFKQPSLSLLGDIARGYWGRIGRLMAGGLLIGLLWESYNYWARGKWIYTVPWLEELKLFEMPPFGFGGFPVFTLEAWSMYAAFCLLGVALQTNAVARIPTKRLAIGIPIGVVFCVFVLLGMEKRTISSYVPRIAGLPGVTQRTAAALEGTGIWDIFDLTEINPDQLAIEAGLTSAQATRVTDVAQLATLRGIGNAHAQTLLDLGINSICQLSQSDPASLHTDIKRNSERIRPSDAEVRVWVRAAGRDCARRLDLSQR